MASIEEQRKSADGLQIPGLVQSQEAIEQLSFTSDPSTPMPLSVAAVPVTAPAALDRYMTPQPLSQAELAEQSQSVPVKAPGLASSLPGLADIDTARQPIVRVEAANTQAFRPLSVNAPGPSSSLPGLADIDTAHQPISQAGIANAESSQSIAPGYMGGPGSSSGLSAGDTTTPSFSQAGLNSTPGISNMGEASQPLAPAGLEKTGVPVLFSPGTTRILPPLSQAGITQTLGETRGAPNTTASRPPMVIRGHSQPNRRRSLRPPQGRRHVISLAAVGLLFVITVGTLLLASPLGQNVRATLSAQPTGASLIQNTPSSMNLIAQATATAVVHQQNDGYDPTSNGGPIVTGSPRPWPYGVCTYWANSRYHELTGNWVTWTGNAYQWADGARQAGWHVSTSPHVPSIIVLMPGVEGASGYGHVAVVESANGDAVNTSNMNWYANGGGFGVVSHYTFYAGSGVYFIWA